MLTSITIWKDSIAVHLNPEIKAEKRLLEAFDGDFEIVAKVHRSGDGTNDKDILAVDIILAPERIQAKD